MPRNIEIKARISEPEALEEKLLALNAVGPTTLFQDDSFFACPAGRLKLRDFGDGQCELIFYRRNDLPGPKPSFYLLSQSQDPAGLRELLTAALGSAGRVIKRRQLFLIGRTRIHVDQVEGLGDFMEIEVVLGDNEPESDGTAVAQALLDSLEIAPDQLLRGAYVDLLAASPQA